MPLEELRARLEPPPAGVNPATALIASQPPKLLREATLRCSLEASSIDFYADEAQAQAAERLLEEALQHPHSRSARRRAREHLEETLAHQQAAKERHDALVPVLALAQEINRTQFELAKPFRILSAVACAAIFSAGGVYLGIDRAHITNHNAVVRVEHRNQHLPPDARLAPPPERLTARQIGITSLLGAAGATSGVFIGAGIGSSGTADYAAQFRARRRIRIAQKR
jgi:hypothetical protein